MIKPKPTKASKRRTKLAKAIADMLFSNGEARGAILVLSYTDSGGWSHKQAVERIEQLLKKWKV